LGDNRSEAFFSVLLALLKAELDEPTIMAILENYPLGEKYREKGRTRDRWLQGEIKRARAKIDTGRIGNAPGMADLKAYLDFEVGPGQPITSDEICRALGAFKRSEKQNIYKGLSRLVGNLPEAKLGRAVGHSLTP